MDWIDWHRTYDDPGSKQARRLTVVRERIALLLDEMAPGPFTVIGMCAGQGLDLLPVLATHPRRADARARLVELDEHNVVVARAAADPATVEVVRGDAGLTAAYAGLVPADLVLVTGVLGNLVAADVDRTVAACAAFCRPGGAVVRTRHRGEPDPVPAVCRSFEQRGFERLFLTPPELGFTVGVHRQTRPPGSFPDERIFTFVGSDVLRGHQATGA
ncbi:SAM-dependent methyltransferase [Micromonosporaceae bacterium Da 78-11]